jgi:hypothetical protein
MSISGTLKTEHDAVVKSAITEQLGFACNALSEVGLLFPTASEIPVELASLNIYCLPSKRSKRNSI